jgi:hypothetical protein
VVYRIRAISVVYLVVLAVIIGIVARTPIFLPYFRQLMPLFFFQHSMMILYTLLINIFYRIKKKVIYSLTVFTASIAT